MKGPRRYNLAWQEECLRKEEAKLNKMVSKVQAFDAKVQYRKRWINALKDPRNGLL